MFAFKYKVNLLEMPNISIELRIYDKSYLSLVIGKVVKRDFLWMARFKFLLL